MWAHDDRQSVRVVVGHWPWRVVVRFGVVVRVCGPYRQGRGWPVRRLPVPL